MSRWRCQAGQPAWVMGVLNCTPDSFSDGGSFQDNGESKALCVDANQALAHALNMQKNGAALIDVGGESTRPGAQPVALDDELQRVIPVIQKLVAAGCYVSIDTMKSEVMRQAIQAGACMVNDVTALTYEEDSLGVVADTTVDVCLMHMQGTPSTMQNRPH